MNKFHIDNLQFGTIEVTSFPFYLLKRQMTDRYNMPGGEGASRVKTEICTFIFHFHHRRVVHAHFFGSLKKLN